MPNVENLRRQAKQYLRWHRERYYPVAAQIRSFLARFGELPDTEVLETMICGDIFQGFQFNEVVSIRGETIPAGVNAKGVRGSFLSPAGLSKEKRE
ncbi:hypothetical protein ACVJBD_006339 [Rhizobium mongolense]